MYKTLRSVKRFVYQIKSYFLFIFVFVDYLKFKTKDKKDRFDIPLTSVLPCLFENTPFTRFDTHYIYHTSWAAKKCFGANIQDFNFKKKDPHEVSKVKCDLCGKEWIAVRPEGLTELECPNCENMVQFENV
jgi:hypothetical protein